MITIGSKKIGSGYGTFIIAEMSANHAGSIVKAKQIIKAAKEAGADAVKLQTYRADTITLKTNKPDFVIPSDNPWSASNTLYDLYEKAFTPWDWHKELFDYAKELGILIFSSPFDETAVDLLEELGTPAYKIASPEITHIPLLQKVAKTKKPVIVSTGVAELPDIDLALKTLREGGATEIVVLKCTSSYPAPYESINLNTMPMLGKIFNCEYGLSDHTLGIAIPLAATALGATVIEKHFLLDKTDSSVDSFFSADRDEFKRMVDEVRNVEKSLGKVCFDLDAEGKKNAWGRRSLYISKNVRKGEILSSDNVKCVRPSFGLHPKHWNDILGQKVNKDLEVGDRLSLKDIEA